MRNFGPRFEEKLKKRDI